MRDKEKKAMREPFDVSSVIIVWSRWNHLLRCHVNGCFLGLSIERGWKSLSISLDQSFASWDINSPGTYRLHVGASESTLCPTSINGEDGRHRHEMKSWWIVTPSSWPESVKNGPLATRSKILVTSDPRGSVRGVWHTLLTVYHDPHCILGWVTGLTEISE